MIQTGDQNQQRGNVGSLERIRFYTGAMNNMTRVLFRNLHPLYGWLFSIAWCAISIAIAIVFFLKQNLTADPMGAAIAIVFPLTAPFVLARFLQVPVISIWEKSNDDWLITRRWPWKVETEQVDRRSLPMPTIEHESDNEGGVKYRCLLRLTKGVIEFAKYRRREQAELACDRMKRALLGNS
ncbi:hypothetical protein [Agrobacterium rubi]|uniref:Uncharacterized protein n=1 Tax=Agrobacterium rubi TaxID=28099 RepID=A0AAE7UTM4_9HYPH|nr:hypothetical protein [Agrobacterium rubi]NTE89623.1 hypothetical protein [Agrobacterium rubi]NTF05527.1 hypothetical protein [Agrobacterium rubi]NTF39970.1 hypothetical protein [Agrobacterium rubi]QTG03837.1 hypothetical protein G6M88_25665 [Agrobacterium rubi]